MPTILRLPTLVAVLVAASLLPAAAAPCGDDAGGFGDWKQWMKAEALATGLSAETASLVDGVTYNREVIRLDRSQKSTFKTDFETFAAKRVTRARLAKGRQMLQAHAALLGRIEERYGVPAEVVVAIWGMETDYGVVTGKMSVIRSLATLAYDCRRADFFTNELLSALRIIENGDKAASDMVGAWAGEIGQTQFLASSYLKYAVDADGDGRRDLIRSTADVLASTANYLSHFGWARGAGFQPGEPNFAVLAGWNKSENYQRAIALFAARLAE